MDMDSGERGSLPGERAGAWVREHLPVLLFALLLLAVLPMRDLWAPDEPDFAQCVKEMQHRGAWLFPWLNGEVYTEKPILFYWAMKVSNQAMAFLTGNLGFTKGLAAWALRLPSAVASVAFLLRFQAWASRFLQKDVARLAVMILATTPIWFWQSHFIQIDMLFSALLAWAWLCWLGGYLLRRGLAEATDEGEAGRFFLRAFLFLGLAFLSKGPLAIVLSGLVLLAFLAWQRDWRILGDMRLGWGLAVLFAIVSPWYIAAGLKGGHDYVYAMVIHQNFERATKAWDHVQPFYQYVVYLLGDFFPWVLLLPPLALFLRGSGALKSPVARFLLLAFVVPFLFLSAVQSKQGKYLLMGYPFLALLVACMLQPLAVEGVSAARIRRFAFVLATGLGIVGLAVLAVALGAGGAKVQAQVLPFRALAWTLGGLAAFGAIALLGRGLEGQGRHLVPETALTLGLVYLVGGTWGFHRLDPQKSFKAWAQAVEPQLAGRQVRFWQTIRSGPMVYTDHLMPEIRDAAGLRALSPEDRLVTMRREWSDDAHGLDEALRSKFEVLHVMPTGGGEVLLLRKRP
jgi:4-amino-4-deoxy-L-arabinose transferase-like glycosyltransferase